MLTLVGCQSKSAPNTPVSSQTSDTPKTPVIYEGVVNIHLSNNGIIVDGESASTQEDAAVYIANDIVYYPTGQDFTVGKGKELIPSAVSYR